MSSGVVGQEEVGRGREWCWWFGGIAGDTGKVPGCRGKCTFFCARARRAQDAAKAGQAQVARLQWLTVEEETELTELQVRAWGCVRVCGGKGVGVAWTSDRREGG